MRENWVIAFQRKPGNLIIDKPRFDLLNEVNPDYPVLV